MVIHTRRYKQSANSEVPSSNDETFILVSANIPIVLSPTSLMLLKTPTKTQIPSTDMIYMQHQFDILTQEMQKNAAENNKSKNLIKKYLAEERIHKINEAEILYEKATILKKENQYFKNEVKNSNLL